MVQSVGCRKLNRGVFVGVCAGSGVRVRISQPVSGLGSEFQGLGCRGLDRGVFVGVCDQSFAVEQPASVFLVSGFRFRFSGFGFRISGFGFRVSVFGFRVSVFGFRVSGFGFRVSGFGFRVSGFEVRVSGFGFRVSDFGSRDEPCNERESFFIDNLLVQIHFITEMILADHPCVMGEFPFPDSLVSTVRRCQPARFR